MTSLTETAEYTRTAIKVAIFSIIFLIIIAISWGVLEAYLESRRPEPEELPTTEFGKLPALSFPKEKARPTTLTLQTIQGVPPILNSIAKVYLIPKKSPTLLTGQKAKQFANELNFPTTPIEKSSFLYKFIDPDYPARSLEYNPILDNFILEYDLKKDSSPKQGDFLPLDENRAISEAETLLNSLNKIHPRLQNGKRYVSFFNFNGQEFIETQNKLQAQFVRVDFLQSPIEELEVKTAKINKSSVYIIFSGRRIEQERIIKINYQFFPASIETFATYPLKSSQSAWNELAAGGGYIAAMGENNENEAFIRDAYLAYFDPGEEQKFLQPIFVFTGDRGFEAYVWAISPEWVQ